jgi:hypothetical protein
MRSTANLQCARWLCAAPDSNLRGDRFDSALRTGSLTQGEEGGLINLLLDAASISCAYRYRFNGFMAHSFISSFAATKCR